MCYRQIDFALLTTDSRMSTIALHCGSNVFHGKKAGKTTSEFAAGNAGHACLANASLWAGTWPSDWQTYSADHERFPADAAWLSLSCLASPRGERLGYLEMGDGSRSQPGVQ